MSMATSAVASKLGRQLGRLEYRSPEGQDCCVTAQCEALIRKAFKQRRPQLLLRKASQQQRLERGYERCQGRRNWCMAAKQDNSDAESGGRTESGSEPAADEDAPPVLKADWRTFRAQLVAQENQAKAQATPSPPSLSVSDPPDKEPPQAVRIQGREWAHAIEQPEKGCLLLASTILDGDDYFDRSVILVLDHSDEGTFGIILNHAMPFTFDRVPRLPMPFQKRFGNERVFLGGPISQGKIFAVSGETNVEGFEEVVPGVFFGEPAACWRLSDLIAAGKAKASSFRFCVGYAGWGRGQLARELREGTWQLAACSADLITHPLSLEQVEGTISRRSGVVLWEQIHELMGGPYADISRKSKRDRGGV